MTLAIRPIPFKPHTLNGLSNDLLVSHYEKIYGDALLRSNAIERHLDTLDWANTAGFEINGLQREALMAANSAILHEIYFDSLGGSGDPEGELGEAISRDFRSVDRWRSQFAALGKALGSGSGWVLLSWCERNGRLINQWASDHSQALAGATPILALDMYEHAYHMDFGANAARYVDAFMQNICWQRAATRFHRAIASDPAGQTGAAAPPQISVEDLTAQIERGQPARVLDVRLKEDLNGANRIPGTEWRDPEQVQDWADTLPRDVPIAVYCMYGFWVSQDTAAALRERGFDARSVAGGISAWRAMGKPTAPLE